LRFFTILNGMPQSRALLARRIDALGASSYLRDGAQDTGFDPISLFFTLPSVSDLLLQGHYHLLVRLFRI
jgi:hypothetical protein